MKNPSLPTIPNISSSSVFILFISLGPLSSIVSPFICCGKGRVGGRTAIFSSLSRTISRDYEHFSRLLMVELNRIRKVSPLPIFRPGCIINNCDEIMCKELHYILLIFVRSFLFWIWYVFLLYEIQFFCILRDINKCYLCLWYSTSFSCSVKLHILYV